MSSTEFVRGLMANIVARRCDVLEHSADRELIWFLQLLSHEPGGLKKAAADLVARFPERVATRAMQRLGTMPGRIYSAAEVNAIRDECPRLDQFRLKGEVEDWAYLCGDRVDPREMERAKGLPASYPASELLEFCRAGLEELPGLLERLCLDPALKLNDSACPWYFPTLIETLREFQAAWSADPQAWQVTTEIGRHLGEALDYCLESARMVVIDGLARTGKTFSAQAWCRRNAGRARCVQVPSSNNEIAFFRAIAASLGVSINMQSKAHLLRDRVEDTLQRSRLMIVFDEAHYLWPQGGNREAAPLRVNWIMTALVNCGVPVALVTTPQFMRLQKRVEQKTCWTSEQFVGRIGFYQSLPDSLSEADLSAVARAQLPEGDPMTIELLVAYARSSSKYLAGIETVVSRARYLAKRDGRARVGRVDIKRAIQESVIPSDNALAAALASSKPASRLKGRSAGNEDWSSLRGAQATRTDASQPTAIAPESPAPALRRFQLANPPQPAAVNTE